MKITLIFKKYRSVQEFLDSHFIHSYTALEIKAKIAQGRENYDWIKRDSIQRTPASTDESKRALQIDQNHKAKTFGA